MYLEHNDIHTAFQLLEKDWFDHYFHGYFMSSNAVTFKKFVRKKRFRISDEKLSPRVLNHWIREGIINDDRENKTGWMSLSLTDAILISIIKKLRSFGMGLSKIRRMRTCLDRQNEMDSQSNCLILDFYLSYMQLSTDNIQLIVLENGESLILRQKVLSEMLQIGILGDYIAVDLNALLVKDRPNMIKEIRANKAEKTHDLSSFESISVTIEVNDKKHRIKKDKILQNKESAEGLLSLLNICDIK